MNIACLGKAPWTYTLAIIALSLHLSSETFSQSVVIEDWDSTPQVPDEVRGWGSVKGPAELESGLGTGNHARAQRAGTIPNFIRVPTGGDPSTWFSNEYVGDKDYAALDVTRVSFLARHDEVEFATQVAAVPTSLFLRSEELVPDPSNPTEMVLPFVWVVSENVMTLGGGWTVFQFDIPSGSVELPEGWRAFPDDPSTWSTVISDVDQVAIYFAPFEIGIGGIPSIWENAIDNFTVEFGSAEEIPAMSLAGLGVLLFGMMGVGLLVASRRSRG